MKIKNIIYLLFLFLMLNISSLAYINISPTTLDKNIGIGAYEEFTFYNNTSVPMRYKLSVIPMESESVKDMSKWVEVYPKVVTVYPSSNETFKLYVQAPKNTADGDYGAFLNIRQVSAPKLEGDAGEQNVAAGMMVMVNVNMGLYGYVGDKIPTVETTTPVVVRDGENQKLQMEIKNTTNRLVRMKVEVKSKKNYFYQVGESRVLRGQTLVYDHLIQKMPLDEEAKEIVITDTETKEVIKKVAVK